MNVAGWRRICWKALERLGGVRGGLSYAVILVGAILGAITGTVAALGSIAIGLISLPIMLRYGYSVRHATGVVAASGTITQPLIVRAATTPVAWRTL